MNVREIVTEQIIDALKAGTVPWHKPWTSTAALNAATGRRYSGINWLLLPWYGIKYGWPHPLFMTYNQVKERGGTVNGGSHPALVVFAKTILKDEAGHTFEITDKDAPDDATGRRILRYYYVYNIASISGIDTDALIAKYCPTRTNFMDADKAAAADRLLHHREPDIRPAPQCFYAPSSDHIGLPPIGRFESAEAYWLAAYHELTHWTGPRLERFKKEDSVDLIGYSKEELTAEIGAAMLAQFIGVNVRVTENSAAYIAGWLKQLEDDKNMIITAASHAERAMSYLIDGFDVKNEPANAPEQAARTEEPAAVGQVEPVQFGGWINQPPTQGSLF
jgi:antirestriction protein ArdC